MTLSCWGCGSDYRKRWRPSELMMIHLTSQGDVSLSEDGEECHICPDCYEEAWPEEFKN